MASKPSKAKPRNPSAKLDPPAPVQAAQPLTVYDLDKLHDQLGAADKAFAKRTFRGVAEEDLVEFGTQTDSQNILDDVPRFIGSALEIQKGLSPEQRKKIRLPAAIFPLLIGETITLRSLKADHDSSVTLAAGEKTSREQAARQEVRGGIAERDIAYDALRNALGSKRMGEVDAIVGTADTAENLAKGLEALAVFIDKTADNQEDALSLEDYAVGPACAAELRARAKSVREAGKRASAPGRKPSQRGLDLQDGRCLHLIEKILRAFRAVRRTDAAILVPELNNLARLFEIRSGKAKAPASPPATPAAGG